MDAKGNACEGWLIVEDEALVAILIEDAITELGLRVIGPAGRVAAALALLDQHHPQGALLDLNLAGEAVYPVAAVLVERQIPFAFLTGYGQSSVLSDYANRPVLQKPFMSGQIQAVIRQIVETERAVMVS